MIGRVACLLGFHRDGWRTEMALGYGLCVLACDRCGAVRRVEAIADDDAPILVCR